MNFNYRVYLLRFTIGIAILLLAFVLPFLYALTVPSVSKKVVDFLLEQQGIHGITYSLRELSLTRLAAEEVDVAGEVSCRELVVSYSLEKLLTGKVGNVEIKGLKVKATVEKGSVVSPFLQSLPPGEEGGEIVMLPFESISVNDASLILDLDEQRYETRLSIDASATGKALEIIGKLQGSVEKEGMQAKVDLDFTASPTSIQGGYRLVAEAEELPLTPEITFRKGSLQLEGEVSYSRERLSLLLKKGRMQSESVSLKDHNALLRKPLLLKIKENGKNILTVGAPTREGRNISARIELENPELLLNLPMKGKETVAADIFASGLFFFSEFLLPEKGAPQLRSAHYAVENGSFYLPDHHLVGNKLFLSGNLDGEEKGKGTFRGDFSQINDIPYFNLLSLKTDFKHDGKGIVMNGHILDIFEHLDIAVSASYELAGGEGNVSFKSKSLNFSPQEFRLSEISPFLGQYLKGVDGKVGLDASLRITGKGMKSRANIALSEVSFVFGDIPIVGVTSSLAFQDLSPLATKGSRSLRVKKIDIKSPLENVGIDFSLRGNRMTVSALSADWLGGTVSLSPFAVSLDKPYPEKLTLTASGLDLAKIMEIVNYPGLSAKGRLEGNIPVTYQEKGEFSINRGILKASSAGGVIRYNPDLATYAMGKGNANMELLFLALEDFHYTMLQMEINGNGSEGIEGDLKLHGSNPSLYDGRPVELNVTLGGELLELARSAVGFYNLPETLKKRYDKIKK